MELRSGYKQTEVGVIPEDWEVYTLGAIGKFKNGLNKGSEAFGHGSPFVNLMDVFGVNSIESVERLGLVASTAFEQSKYDLRRSDVVFVRSSVKPSGVGLTAVIENDLPGTVYSGFLIRFRDDGFIDLNFKKYCFYEEGFRKRIIGASSVSANTNVNQDSLKGLSIVLPPFAEQQAIAEALSDVDGLISALDALIAKKRAIKQGAMQELLTGQRRLPGFAGAWEVKTLGEIADVKTGPFGAQLHESDYVRDGTPIITVEHLGEFGVDCKDTPPMVSDQDKERLKQYTLYEGDIVFSRVGSIDRNALIKASESGWLFSGRLLRVRPTADVNSAFLSYYFHGEDFKLRIRAVAVGQTMASLNTVILNNAFVAIPALPEQTAIAQILADMDAEIAALAQKRDKTQAIKQGMMQALLTGQTRVVLQRI